MYNTVLQISNTLTQAPLRFRLQHANKQVLGRWVNDSIYNTVLQISNTLTQALLRFRLQHANKQVMGRWVKDSNV